MEKLITHLNELIAKGEQELKENECEFFYDLSLDKDGMPYSFGNADDVYSDGFEAGIKAGENQLANEILKMLEDNGV